MGCWEHYFEIFPGGVFFFDFRMLFRPVTSCSGVFTLGVLSYYYTYVSHKLDEWSLHIEKATGNRVFPY